MATDLKSIINNVKDIYSSDSSLETLLSFERVIDELDVYVFKNWKLGELVDGPAYEKYFVTCTFMWPYKAMPDPRGGEQLLNYNCIVEYKKDKLVYPMKIKGQDDFAPGTKVAKKKTANVWLVRITIPKKLMFEISQGAVEVEGELVDEQDLDQAYEEGVDEEMNSDASDQFDPGSVDNAAAMPRQGDATGMAAGSPPGGM